MSPPSRHPALLSLGSTRSRGFLSPLLGFSSVYPIGAIEDEDMNRFIQGLACGLHPIYTAEGSQVE